MGWATISIGTPILCVDLNGFPDCFWIGRPIQVFHSFIMIGRIGGQNVLREFALLYHTAHDRRVSS